jgi:hypothetical protein
VFGLLSLYCAQCCWSGRRGPRQKKDEEKPEEKKDEEKVAEAKGGEAKDDAAKGAGEKRGKANAKPAEPK